ncbi:MAG: hypothetical protein R6V58_15075, partial [Planctomycetota bacterium]
STARRGLGRTAAEAPKLDRIVGGDPYAYYSRQMGRGDHAAWRITGLEAKSDGTVYVLGNANNYGPPALRAYRADGKYLRTVYPPPAGRPVEQMKGWGVNVRADGTYTPQYNDLSSPALSRTIICGTRGRIADLVPSPAADRLLLVRKGQHIGVGTDGTLLRERVHNTPLIVEPPMRDPERRAKWQVIGQRQYALSADGGHLYLNGIFGAGYKRQVWNPSSRRGADTTGPWRDGQVYRVDLGTHKAEVFFALDEETLIGEMKARQKSPIADAPYGPYAALQGVATDREGHVFVGDRQNERILVLTSEGKIIREIPCKYPDALAVSPNSNALYVTTRTGHYHGPGTLKLLKFKDWTKAKEPAVTLPVCQVRYYRQPTRLVAVESTGEVYVWIAYTALPARVYRDKGDEVDLVRDFYKTARQRCLDVQHFAVDRETEHVYIADGFGSCFRITDWGEPQFRRCMLDKNKPLRAIALAVDARNRRLYTRNDRSPVRRYKLDQAEFLTPVPVGETDSNACTPVLSNDWRIGLGKGDRGIGVAPDGSLATLGALGRGANYGGYLRYFDGQENKAPWDGLLFNSFGTKVRAAGVRFDPRGNLYAGKYDGKPKNPPEGFEKDRKFLVSTGRIYKYAPTGSLKGGNLFPAAPERPAKVYDIHYGAIGNHFSRTPRFGVDGYGRIYYPTSLLPRVSVIDNAGNTILRFGTYGNRDSMCGLEGDIVPTKGVPMAWPNSVDATDDHIYVSDIVNIRLLRLAKTFAASETVDLE